MDKLDGFFSSKYHIANESGNLNLRGDLVKVSEIKYG